MSEKLIRLQQDQDRLMNRTARLIALLAQRGFKSSHQQRTGKTVRSFKPATKKDRFTRETWAAGVRAKKKAFVLNHGQGPGTKSGGQVRQHSRERQGTTYMVRQHSRRAVAGTHFLENAINKVYPGFRRKALDIIKEHTVASVQILDTKQSIR